MTAPRRQVPDNERGSAIVMVLMVSMLLMGALVVALTVSDFSGTLSTQYGTTSQSSLAAQSGLAVELSAMRTVSLYTSLPCGAFSGSLTATGAVSSYSGTVTYYPSGTNPSALTCNGSTLGGVTAPATATIASTGTTAHGSPTTMHEIVAIATTSTPAQALGYALYTTNSLDLTGAAALTNSGSYVANIYSGGTLTCGTGDSSPGSVTTYGAVDFTGSCSIGGLTASGAVTLENSAAVNGNLISYAGPLTMSGTTEVTGTATETSGNISLSGSTIIKGNTAASGTITLAGGSSISPGTKTPGDLALSSQTMPAAVSFPVLNPSDATWLGQGWSVVDVASANCGTYFQSNSSGAADPFMTAISTETSKTVYDATSCSPSYSRSQTFSFNADTVLEVASFTTVGSDTYSSTTATVHDFSLLASPGVACSTSAVDISVSNSSTFASSLVVFMYTPGEASYANSPSMIGQIVACGGITGSNSFVLTFNSSASAEIPGSSSATAPTVSVLNKYFG